MALTQKTHCRIIESKEMKQTFKYFWAHRKQNGFVLIEIALVAFLSFYSLDYMVVSIYDTYLCKPAGEVEKEHLLVATIAKDANNTSLPDSMAGDDGRLQAFEREALRLNRAYEDLRDSVRALPEVQSASIIATLGYRYSGRVSSVFCPEADTTRRCITYSEDFPPHEQFVETLGLTTIEGSPSAEELSEIDNGIIISRSVALALFDTDQVVGRRLVELVHTWNVNNTELEGPYVIRGVMEDFRIDTHDRYAYSALIPNPIRNNPYMLIRLKPDVDAEAFINKTPAGTIEVSGLKLFTLRTYDEFTALRPDDYSVINSLLGTFITLLLINVVLGTLGTFWLQIRKRTEDVGIMRSFGAKRRNIFGMLWKEAALLTLIASILGQLIWLQVAQNSGLAHGGTTSGTNLENDWPQIFWQHYLVICVLQFLILLLIVTIGMVVPTFLAMYKRPVEALHHE